MWQLAGALVEIALRRRGPDSLPDSTFLVYLLLLVHILLTLVMTVAVGVEITTRSLAQFAAITALMFAFVYAVLSFFRLDRRYRQTMSAILGAEIVINLVFLPIGIAGVAFGFDVVESPLIWIRLLFYVWYAYVAASILARSLSQPFIVGLMLEVLLIVTSLRVAGFLGGPSELITMDPA